MNVVTLLREMIGFDTVNAAISGRVKPETALSAHLETHARDIGLATELLPVPSASSNLLITYEREPSLPWILFDSHLDTVSVEGMSIEPFAGTVRDGRVWGRGACDTKGSGAAMLAALAEYSAGATGSNNIILLFSVGEEVGMTGIWSFAGSGLIASHNIRACVVGEPTGLLPVIAHNGVERYIISATGVAAHSADPSKGVSAISVMAELVLYLEREYIPSLAAAHPLTGKAQCSINVIQGGSAINIIPDRCEIRMDRRMVPGEVSTEVRAELKQHLGAFSGTHADVVIGLEPFTETPPLALKEDEPFVESVRTILRRRGHPDNATGVRYATHAGVLAEVGLTCVVLGPGSIDQAHTREEWIDVDELEAAVPVYVDIMRSCDT